MQGAADDLVPAWWADWERDGYHWDNLHTHHIPGGGAYGSTNLAEYWQFDPDTGSMRSKDALIASGEIIVAANGVAFHIVHLPPKIGNAATFKADLGHSDWTRVDEIVRKRIAAAQPTEGGRQSEGSAWRPSGRDHRALLDGAILKRMSSAPDALHVRGRRMAFLGRPECEGVKFGPGLHLASALFCGGLDCRDATFGDANFNNALFVRAASFRGARFAEKATFSRATWMSDARFDHARLKAAVSFLRAQFKGETRFDYAEFEDGCTFEDASLEYASFISSGFRENPDLGGVTVGKSTRFDRVQFRKLNSVGFVGGWFFLFLAGMAWLYSFAALNATGLAAWVLWPLALIAVALALYWQEAGAMRLIGRASDLSRAVESFRTMKVNCDEAQNSRAEALFLALELKAMRMQPGFRVRDVLSKPFERFFSVGYEVLADYGQSITRPLIFLVAGLYLFAWGYWRLEGDIKQEAWTWSIERADPNYIAALSFSASRTVPISPLVEPTGGRPVECPYAQRLLAHGVDEDGDPCLPTGLAPNEGALEWHRLLVRAIATLQSILSGVLIFLAGLAVQRRFRMD